MTNDDLDRCYTALSEAIGRMGADKKDLLLATLGLSLLAREAAAAPVLALIAQAERLALT